MQASGDKPENQNEVFRQSFSNTKRSRTLNQTREINISSREISQFSNQYECKHKVLSRCCDLCWVSCIGVICKIAKKYRFCPFSVSGRWKKVRGRRSDNFEATGRAHSSFGSFLPIFFGEHIEIGITSETVGPRPPWSEMIQICVLKKALF